MAPEQIATILRTQFADAISGSALDTPHPAITVAAQRWREIALYLRDDPRLRLNALRCISGVDRLEEDVIELVYDLLSMQSGGRGEYWRADNEIALKVRVPRDGRHVASVADI